MRRNGWLIFSSACILSGAALLLAHDRDLPVVTTVDLARYSGHWFEIARLPTSFQRKCESDVTTTYTLQPNGTIHVVNTCKQRDGNVSRVEGTARLRNKDGFTTKLKVTFFWPLPAITGSSRWTPATNGRWWVRLTASICGCLAGRANYRNRRIHNCWQGHRSAASTPSAF